MEVLGEILAADPLVVQLYIHTGTAVESSIGMVGRLNLFGQLCISLRMVTYWTLAPIVIAAHGHFQGFTQQTHRIFSSMRLDNLIPHCWSRVKIPRVFFRISRSFCTRSNSRFRRRISSSCSVWCPLPGKASDPCSANSLRH